MHFQAIPRVKNQLTFFTLVRHGIHVTLFDLFGMIEELLLLNQLHMKLKASNLYSDVRDARFTIKTNYIVVDGTDRHEAYIRQVERLVLYGLPSKARNLQLKQ